jgi:acylphosphatase
MAAPEGKAFRGVVRGRVQGVGFRYSAIRQARALGIRGTVANRSDGSVEILAEGEPAALDRFLAWLENGPAGARVSGVQVEWLPPTDAYAEFEVEF